MQSSRRRARKEARAEISWVRGSIAKVQVVSYQSSVISSEFLAFPGRLLHQDRKLKTENSRLLGFQPVLSSSDLDVQTDAQGRGSRHDRRNEISNGLHLPFRRLEHELVMHLQEQPSREAALRECLVQAHHRDFEDVRRGSLERSV